MNRLKKKKISSSATGPFSYCSLQLKLNSRKGEWNVSFPMENLSTIQNLEISRAQFILMTKPNQLSLLFNKLENSPSDNFMSQSYFFSYRHYHYNLTEVSITKLHPQFSLKKKLKGIKDDT